MKIFNLQLKNIFIMIVLVVILSGSFLIPSTFAQIARTITLNSETITIVAGLPRVTISGTITGSAPQNLTLILTYSTSSLYLSTSGVKTTSLTPNTSGVFSHSITSGLALGTTYYYKIETAGFSKNDTFHTLGGGTPPPPHADVYQLLAPLPDVSGGLEEIDTNDPAALGKYFNLIFSLFIGVASVLAVIMIVIAGIQYMSTDAVTGKEEGKKKIQDAILGLVLILGAWLILHTINPDLVNLSLGVEGVSIEVDDTPQVAIGGQYCRKSGGPYQEGSSWTNARGLIPILPTRVTLNHGGETIGGNCTTVGQPSCTSTIGLDPASIEKIREKCPDCELKITGGTECWLHGGSTQDTYHRIGSSVIDLSATPSLNSYIMGNNINDFQAGQKTQEINRDGLRFYYHGPDWHWHVGR